MIQFYTPYNFNKVMVNLIETKQFQSNWNPTWEGKATFVIKNRYIAHNGGLLNTKIRFSRNIIKYLWNL